ncbi:hypothetical protein T439DRAFT_360638 [Meredithblackwellia eburnea MCA 4105]
MPPSQLYHVVLYKLLPTCTPEQVATFATMCEAMVGVIPGLISLDIGYGIEATKHMAQGYDLGIVAVLQSVEYLNVYQEHPAHKSVLEALTPLRTPGTAANFDFYPGLIRK